MIIIKQLTDSGNNWVVYHENSNATPEDYYLRLNTDHGAADLNTMFNDTAPTDEVFTVGSSGHVNQSGKAYIAYCFARTAGLIGIGGYTGNNSTDGPGVIVDDGSSGFKPAMIINKSTNDTGAWQIRDNLRSTYNPASETLEPNEDRTESAVAAQPVDFLANGFKPRTTGTNVNGSSWTYVYLAFAETPFGLNNRAR
jgi:hypothetical protein